MQLSEQEITVALHTIESRYLQANTHCERLNSDSTEKSALEKEIEILKNIKDKLSSSIGANTSEGNDAGTDPVLLNYSNHHFLLVDDNESIRKHMMLLLKKHGFSKFDEAEDGHDAIAKIKSKIIPYDLILCDMNMPTISGLDVLKLMRKESSLSEIPFIMVTSDSNKELLMEAIKAGVSDFVAKPVDEANLMKRITALL